MSDNNNIDHDPESATLLIEFLEELVGEEGDEQEVGLQPAEMSNDLPAATELDQMSFTRQNESGETEALTQGGIWEIVADPKNLPRVDLRQLPQVPDEDFQAPGEWKAYCYYPGPKGTVRLSA